MIITTINHIYNCESCGYVYTEQRKPEEVNAYFTKCPSCGGNFVEVSTEELTHEEPDPVIDGEIVPPAIEG